MHIIKTNISSTTYFGNQKEMAEFLQISNSSKKAITSNCRKLGYGVEYHDYYGEHNLEMTN